MVDPTLPPRQSAAFTNTRRQIVFTGRDSRFAGMASPSALLDGMGAHFPILDAFTRELRAGNPSEDRSREIDRQIEAWSRVFMQPGITRGPSPPIDPPILPGVLLPASEHETKVGIREELLQISGNG